MPLQGLITSIYAFIILIILLTVSCAHRQKTLVEDKLFISMVITNMVLLVIDFLGWTFNGREGRLSLILNILFNQLLYMVNAVPPILWASYTEYHINRSRHRLQKIQVVFRILFYVNAILTLSSLSTGWFFYIDSNNIYHRGTLFIVHVAICYAMVLYNTIFILSNRKKADKRHILTMVLYPLPQIVAGILQSIYYGLSLTMGSMTISLIILYLSIQDKSMNEDYLTGVYNRRFLDRAFADKIQNGSNINFSMIMIDVNQFKIINDTYGHAEGDSVLQKTAEMIKAGIGKRDVLARYGGDEFCILTDDKNTAELEQKINNIRETVREYNKKASTPYRISFSIGYGVFDKAVWNGRSEQFIRYVDQLMYEDKKLRSQAVPAL